MRTDESRIPSRAREVLAHVRSLGILSAWLGILGISGQLGAGLGMAGHFLGGSTREREERGEDGPGGDAERQDICCKCQVLALTWRSLVCLGAAWHGCSAVSGLAEGRCGRGAQGPGWRCCVALCRAHGPFDLWRLHQQVRPAGGRLARLANGRRLASEPRLPRVCQALRQCYCHEREGVIKTERPAVLVKSAVDQFSPLHHLEALQQVDSLWQQVLGLFSCPDRIARVPCCVPLLPDFLGTPRPQPLHRHAHFGLGAPAASSHPALGGLGKKWDRLFCLRTQPNAPTTSTHTTT